MKRHITGIITIIFVLLFSGCEYETDNDHYVEIQKPSENIQLDINLPDIGDESIIYIYTTTRISYSITDKTNNRNPLKVTYTLDNQPLTPFLNTIILEPVFDDEKDHELRIKVEVNTNTGSLADRLYLERYTGEFSFKIRYIKADQNLNITQEFTDEGYLKLIWDNPALLQTPVEKYEISYFETGSQQEKKFVIDDPQNTFFIDEDYVYGFREYRIATYFKNNKISTWTQIHIAEYKELTPENISLNLRQQRSAEGYLELLWDKPNVERMPVSSYSIEYYDKQLGGLQSKVINDVDKTSFIDENYAYGDRDYYVKILFSNGLYSLTAKHTAIYRKLTTEDFVFEDVDLETVRISWPPMEFNCTQIVRLFDNENILIPDDVHSLTFERLEFPYITWHNDNRIELHILGAKTKFDLEYHPVFYSQGAPGRNYVYDRFYNIEDPLHFVAYTKENLLYTLARRGIYSTNMDTKKVVRHLSFDETISLSMSCDQYSPKIAVRDYNKISIYENHSFRNFIQFELGYGAAPRYEILKFTSDNKLLLTSNMSYSNYSNVSFMAFDASSGDYLYDIPIPTSGKNIDQMVLSADNKYLLLGLFSFSDASLQEVKILELVNNKLHTIKTFTYDDLMADGPFFHFNPLVPNQIIQGDNYKFKVFELPALNKIAEVEGEFATIDVVNGNFLYTSSNNYKYIHIMNPSLSEEILMFKVRGIPLSYNNVLVSPDMHGWGSYFDLSKFIK